MNVLLVPLYLLFLPLLALAEGPEPTRGRGIHQIPPSTNQVLRITEDGLSQKEIRISRAGSSVFFLNATKDSALDVEVDYGKKYGFCATGDMKMDSGGTFSSKTSFGPQTFIIVCFPQAGTYPARILGVKGSKNPLKATLVVESGSIKLSKEETS